MHTLLVRWAALGPDKGLLIRDCGVIGSFNGLHVVISQSFVAGVFMLTLAFVVSDKVGGDKADIFLKQMYL